MKLTIHIFGYQICISNLFQCNTCLGILLFLFDQVRLRVFNPMCRFGFIDMMHCESHHRVDYYTAQYTCMVFSSQPSKPKQSISPTYIHLIYTFLIFLDFEVKYLQVFNIFAFHIIMTNLLPPRL